MKTKPKCSCYGGFDCKICNPDYYEAVKPKLTRDSYDQNWNIKTDTPRTDAYHLLPSKTDGEKALIRELMLLRSDSLEYQTHERDSNYRWEKIPYGTGHTKIKWAYWKFRLAYQPLTPCKAI